jgi:transcriptional regulator with XRE-family HTH domain
MAKIVKKIGSDDPKSHYKMHALRLALGLTQEELGELCGVSHTYIGLYERGTVDGEYLENNVNTSLSGIRDKLIEKYGYWYDAYIELKTNLNLLDIWMEFEGRAPIEIIQKAKESAAAFVHI